METHETSSSGRHVRAWQWLRAAWGLAVAWLRRGASADRESLLRWLPWLALAALCAWLVTPRVPVAALAAVGLLLAVLVPAMLALKDRLRASERWSSVVRRLEIPAVMVALAWVIYVSLLPHLRHGIVLDTGDHQLMLARSRAIQQALVHGHVPKWTLAMQGGEPLTDLYPYLFDAVLTPLKLFFPGPDGYRKAYHFGVLALFWLRGVAGYALARRLASPWAALLVAAASFFDVGNAWDGTWSAALYWGMVHSNLSLTLCAFAVALQIDLSRTGSTPRLVLAVLLGAMGMLAHPVGVVFLGVATGALLLAAWLRKTAARSAMRSGVAGLLAFALAAFWVIPYTDALRGYGYVFSAAGLQYAEGATGLLDGSLPGSALPAYVGLTTLAVLVALTAEDAALVAMAVAALALWTLTFTPLAVSSGFTELYPEYLDGQPRRFNHGVKVAILPVLAWLIDRGYRLLREPRSFEVRAVLGRALVAALLFAGFLRVASNAVQALQTNVRMQIPNSAEPGRVRAYAGPDHEKVFDWLRQMRAADKNPTRWRLLVRYADPGPHMPHAVWSEGFASLIPIVDLRYFSTAFLKNRPRELSVEALREWNVRYMLTDTPTAPAPNATRVFQSGSLLVWQNTGYDGRTVVAPAGVSLGKLQVSDEHVAFTVSGVPSAGIDLRVRTAWFPRWTARSGDSRLAVVGVPPFSGAQERQDQILIRGVKNGPVMLRCDGPLPRSRSSALFSIIGLFGLGLACSRRGRDRLSTLAQRAAGRVVRWRRTHLGTHRRWAAVLTGALLLACGAVWCKGSARIRYPAIEGLGMRVWHAKQGKLQPCSSEWWLGRYVCDDTVIMAWGGYDDHTDQSGETPHQWPAVLARSGAAETRLRFAFPRIDLRGDALELTAQSSAGFDLRVRADGRYLFAQLPPANVSGPAPASAPGGSARAKATAHFAAGKKVVRWPIPSALKGARDVTLDFTLSVPGSMVLFAGRRL